MTDGTEEEDAVLAEIQRLTANRHPMIGDKIENERCPNCGTPGKRIDNGDWWPFETWACPNCDREEFEETDRS